MMQAALALPMSTAAQGYSPRPYQRDCLDAIKAAAQLGVRRQLVSLPTGTGKALGVDEPVLTPSGWRAIGSLAVNDLVCSNDGRVYPVCGVYPQGVRDLFRVTFTDGEFVDCDGDHLWEVRTRYDAYDARKDGRERWRVKRTADLCGGRKWQLPAVAPIEMGEPHALPLPPYVLGVLIGDGCLRNGHVSVSSPDQFVLDELLRLLPGAQIRHLGRYDYALNYGHCGLAGSPLIHALRQLDLFGKLSVEKHIPRAYLTASAADRLELLRGLMDTDGTTQDFSGEFSTSSPQLAADVVELVRSLGGVTRSRERTNGFYTYRGERRPARTSYRILVRIADGLNPFSLPRKADKYAPTARAGHFKAIETIEPAGRGEAVCIAIDSPRHLYLTRGHTPTHNTVAFSHLPETLGISRMLVLAHREELLDQAAEKIRAVNPSLWVEVEQGSRHASSSADVVVASVATLGRAGGGRIRKWRAEDFGAIVVDEAHHATASTYLRILREYRAGEPGGPLLLGVTATPFRGDGEPLANVFDEVVFEMALQNAIEAGWLSRIRAVRVKTRSNLSGVHRKLGDFAANELAEAINTDERNSLVCSAIEDHAASRSCILVFAADVNHVETLTLQLRDRGHAADRVIGDTESEARRRTFAKFRDGETRILVNCGIAVEGYDNPAIDCIVMARPTQSPLMYAQMLGRGTRPSPDTGKQDLLVVDVVDICGRHAIQTAATAFGMREIDLLGEDVLLAAAKVRKAWETGRQARDGESLADIEADSNMLTGLARRTVRIQTEAQAVDVFAAVEVRPEVERDSIFPWFDLGGQRYRLQLGKDRGEVRLERDALGVWRAWPTVGEHAPAALGESDTTPFQAADRCVKRWAGTYTNARGEEIPAWKSVETNAWWRRQPPTDSQLATLRKMGILAFPKNLNKGSASQMISHLIAMRNEGRAA